MNKPHGDIKALLLFNPEHDLALANGQAHFMPPAAAVAFAREAAILPIWIYGKGFVITEPIPDSFIQFLSLLNIDIQIIDKKEIVNVLFSEINPWGWDLLLRNNLLKSGIDEKLILSIDKIEKIKELSNRKLALKAHETILKKWPFGEMLPEAAKFVTKTEESFSFFDEKMNIIMKMPWSGSGKGLRFCRGEMTAHDKGWIKNVIERQAGAIIEQRYDVKEDFALEYICKDNKVEFCGYSLFFTQNGAYQGNYLLSNDAIISKLDSFIDKKDIEFCRDFYKTFLEDEVAPHYNGFVGVDMFVYEEDNRFKLHPACEINLRSTMGILARKIADNHIDTNSSGVLLSAYSEKNGELAAALDAKQTAQPLEISNGKIISGCQPLFPVNNSSHYSIWIEVKKD
ncbi:MAG: hypothetical protein IJT51_04725 [Bacteroidales bacterium]|nr:hypothetical protein [Bacteroidales bacterium]